MNINIASRKKKKTNIGFGLNNRGGSKAIIQKSSNVLLDGSDDDGDDGAEEDENLSGKAQVNKQIAAEQAALRKRAQAAAAAIQDKDPSVYDYDGAYDSFQPGGGSSSTATKNTNTNKSSEEQAGKSRYIGDLLKAAKKRERERDVIYERKVAREQEEEDAQADYKGKEKFVTKAYKRKLEERKQWEAEEEEKQQEEDRNDVTKKTGGMLVASFYGNFCNNVSVGGKKQSNEKEKEEKDKTVEHDEDKDASRHTDDFKESSGGGLGFLDGFERSGGPEEEDDDDQGVDANSQPAKEANSTALAEHEMKNSQVNHMTMRQIREKKIAEARIRYLERRLITQ
jgi:coiled-coil domain-containing protein 55